MTTPQKPPTWVLSDGTEVELGGVVRGDSPAAVVFRHGLERLADGIPVPVPMWPPPGGSEPLELQSAPHVDSWVRRVARCLGATIVSAPAFEHLPSPDPSPEPRGNDDPEVVY